MKLKDVIHKYLFFFAIFFYVQWIKGKRSLVTLYKTDKKPMYSKMSKTTLTYTASGSVLYAITHSKYIRMWQNTFAGKFFILECQEIYKHWICLKCDQLTYPVNI